MDTAGQDLRLSQSSSLQVVESADDPESARTEGAAIAARSPVWQFRCFFSFFGSTGDVARVSDLNFPRFVRTRTVVEMGEGKPFKFRDRWTDTVAFSVIAVTY
jgi:hypothetical protein